MGTSPNTLWGNASTKLHEVRRYWVGILVAVLVVVFLAVARLGTVGEQHAS